MTQVQVEITVDQAKQIADPEPPEKLPNSIMLCNRSKLIRHPLNKTYRYQLEGERPLVEEMLDRLASGDRGLTLSQRPNEPDRRRHHFGVARPKKVVSHYKDFHFVPRRAFGKTF